MIMNKRIILAISVAMLPLAACRMEEQEPESARELLKSQAKMVRVCFTTSEEDTKAAFGQFEEGKGYPTFWTADDQSIAMSLNFAEPVEATMTKESDVSANAQFTASFEDTGAPYKFFALSPLSAVNAASESRSSWTVSIPTVQTPKADGLSCDEAAMLLYSSPDEVQAIPTEPIRLKFGHVTTYCRLTLKNLATAFSSFNVTNPTVKSVDLTFSVPVAGEWYVNAADGSLEEKEASRTITVRTTVQDLSQPAEMWLAMAPCTLDGATVKVAVNTDKGCLSRSYTYGTRTYAAGAVNKLSLDMTKNASFDEYAVAFDETVFYLVTDINDISKNDEVIFVDGPVPEYAMSSTFTSRKGLVSVAKDASNGFTYNERDGYIRLPEGSKVMVMTVYDKSSSSVKLKYGNQYLNTSSYSTSYFPTLSNSSRTFTLYDFDGGQIALYYTSGSYYTYYYSLYGDTDYFKIYRVNEASVIPLAIYKKTTVTSTSGVDPDTDPIMEEEQFGAYLQDGNIVHEPNVTQLSREYSGNTLTFAILFPANNKVVEFNDIPANLGKGDSFTLDLRSKVGRKNTSLGTFEVTAIKEDGSKVWLSDFNGNGFIVKR